MPTHILSGMGTTQTTNSPAVTETPQTITAKTTVVFLPGCPTVVPPLVTLMSASMKSSFTVSCVGIPTDFHDAKGTLNWSDGTTSKFGMISMDAVVVQGHGIGRSTGTVTEGHFQGATIDILGLELAQAATACLTGGSVPSSSGANVFVLTSSD